MRFEAKMDYTLKDIRQYWKVHQLFRGKALYYISWILVAAVLVVVVSLGVLLVVNRIFSGELIWYYVIILAMLAAYWAVREIRVRTNLKTLTGQGIITLTAEEEGLHAQADALSSDYSYQAFQDIARYKGAYYLYIDKRRALIVPDHCFTEGDPAAFGPFIEEKTGLRIRNIGG